MSNLSSNDILVYNIKYYRLLKGITQAQMAEALNITEKHYCHLENFKYQVTLKNLDIIAKILGKEPWELLKERHSKKEISLLNRKMTYSTPNIKIDNKKRLKGVKN